MCYTVDLYSVVCGTDCFSICLTTPACLHIRLSVDLFRLGLFPYGCVYFNDLLGN